MKRFISGVAPVACLALFANFPFESAVAETVFSVTNYGAKCDGRTDDTAAVQRAINAAEAAGGGTVQFPRGMCLLNTNYPSRHPWFFYNLILDSNVKLRGETGAKLLQGPGGIHAIVERAQQVRNTVLAFGQDYASIRFQNTNVNGGFFGLHATTQNQQSVTLSNPADAAKFKPGDYVAIYKFTTGDVIPTETTRLTAVDSKTGTLGLENSLARSFPTPVIANVTKLAITNIGVENLIVEGVEPLAVTEAFGFRALNNQFLIEASVGGSNCACLNLNSLNDFQFIGNTFTSIGPVYAGLELTQRNSRYGLFDDNTFIGSNMGFGECAAHIVLKNNRFRIYADPSIVAGVFIGGMDVTFANNDVRGGNITGGSGWGALLADYVGPVEYASYVGQIRIINNTFEGQTDGDCCLLNCAADTVIEGNKITVFGSGLGIHVEGPGLQSTRIVNNSLRMGTGDGILVVTPPTGGSGTLVSGNTIVGSGWNGVFLASRGAPNAGGVILSSNTITGFKTPVTLR